MKVWVVCSGGVDSFEVEAVYATKELAEARYREWQRINPRKPGEYPMYGITVDEMEVIGGEP